MRHTIVVVFLSIIPPLFAVSGSNMAVTVNLKVVDEVGAILPGATVAIYHWTYDKGSQKFTPIQDATIRTDSHGEVSIRLIPGIYDVSISFAAFLPNAQRIIVSSKGKNHFHICLNFDRHLKSAGGS